MRAPSMAGSGFWLALLVVLILSARLVSDNRAPVTRRFKRRLQDDCEVRQPPPARPDLGLRLARWLGVAARRLGLPLGLWFGAALRRLWREFYYWTVGDLEVVDAPTVRGFCLSEMPDAWYAYRVRAEGRTRCRCPLDLAPATFRLRGHI